MNALFKKLNLGTHSAVVVLNAPRSFEPELAALQGVSVTRSVSGPCTFAMAFVITPAELDAAGFEPVRMVAIDADWSALRFRRVEYIKTMARRKA